MFGQDINFSFIIIIGAKINEINEKIKIFLFSSSFFRKDERHFPRDGPFLAAVAAQHGGSVKLDSSLM